MADTTTPHPYEAYHKASKTMQSIEQGREPRTAKASLDLLENTVKYLRANAKDGVLDTQDGKHAKGLNEILGQTLVFGYLLPSATPEVREFFTKNADGKEFIDDVVLQSHFGMSRKKLDKALTAMKNVSALNIQQYLGNFNTAIVQKRAGKVIEGLKLESDADVKNFNDYLKTVVKDNASAVDGAVKELEAKGIKLGAPNDKNDVQIWSAIVGDLPDDYVPAVLKKPTV